MNIFNLAVSPKLTKEIPSKSRQVGAWLGMSRHSTEISGLRCYLSLLNTSMQIIKDIDAFLREILMITEPFNLIGGESILAYNLWQRIFQDMGFPQKTREL